MSLKILCAWGNYTQERQVEQLYTALSKAAEEMGIELELQKAFSINSIKNKLSNGDYDALLTQMFAFASFNGEGYSVEDLDGIQRSAGQAKIVMVCPPLSPKIAPFLENMFELGLYYAVLAQDNDNTPTEILKLITRGRTRAEAERYYGLVKEKVKRSGIVNQKSIQKMHDYLFSDVEDEPREERLKYLQDNCSADELTALFERLSDDEVAQVKDFPGFEGYFTKNGVKLAFKKQEEQTEEKKKSVVRTVMEKGMSKAAGSVLRSMADAISPDEEVGRKQVVEKIIKQTEYREVETIVKQYVTKRVIGVISAYRGGGATYTTLALAKYLSQYEDVTVMEYPREEEAVYNRLRLDLSLGATFKSVPHMIDKGEELSAISNKFEGIHFFVANPSYGPTPYTIEKLERMKNFAEGNVVIDLGSGLSEIKNSGVMSMLTHVVYVYDRQKEDTFLSRIKDEQLELDGLRIAPFILAYGDKPERKGLDILKDDLRNLRTKLTNTVNGDVIPMQTFTGDQEAKLLEYLHITSPKTARRKERIKVVVQGTVNVALVSTAPGAGLTHTALMLADAVRQEKRVAILDLSAAGKMNNLALETGTVGDVIKLYGIDIYYNTNYRDFEETYKRKYDYIFMMLGTVDELKTKVELFARAEKRYLIFDPAPWQMQRFDDAISIIDEIEGGDVMCLAPRASGRTLRDMEAYKRAETRDVVCIPCSESPVKCKEETSRLMRKILGL